MHNNYPVVDHNHENFMIYYDSIKKNNLLNIQNIESKELCKKIENKNIDRHSFRWVFEEFRIKIIDIVGKNFNSDKGTSITFTLMISFLIISTFFISILTVEKNLFDLITKNKKNFIFLLLLFFFIIAFYSFRLVSELRFSFFEMFFISTALYSSYRKSYLLFLFSIVMATLNRESGIIVSSIWLIINGFNFRDHKFILDKKEILIGLIFIIISVSTLILFNYKLFNCFFSLDFLYYEGYEVASVINTNILKNFNTIFANFFIIIFLLYYFYVDFNKQIKLILIILFYNFIFLFFTPPDHAILRIMFAPIFVLYAYEYIVYKKVKNYD